MAIWMQVSDVSMAELSEKQAAAVEAMVGEDAWVEVTDGDYSIQRAIDLADVVTTAELLRRITEGETYGYIATDGEHAEIAALAAEETPGYFSRQRVYLIEA
jgi:hypothetical protein